ncbi:patatin-like phospholipase family protein [Chryseolinea sp. T2]|uniref:patatin-like phospholipase family protein n=1 Tax=Chryseolinea sp. T2 TaxID=3129255 RepID=UPI003078768D
MRSIFVVILLLAEFSLAAQPKIGLTLSGGGAKGLAHIGILEALDSAGLRIDCITGTSMGSIVGSLYAAGYSGKDIEKIARELDWNVLFSGKPSMRTVNIDEKTEFDNYALEVPVQKGKFKIRGGIIEGQEIWLKFQELFLPIYDIKDFSRFSIPFRCVATDIATGKAVVLDQGELVTAIRASMAIPSVFTPIDYKDTKLVDGGIVRNFPVRDVKDMGAEYVIGVNLSQGLATADKLNSVLDILYQIGFYKDADDFEHEKQLCNVLIEPPLSDYSAASFASAQTIIDIGKETGKKYYPVFKKLADSLRSVYPNYKPIENRLPVVKQVAVDSIRILGLQHTTNRSFKNRLALEPGKSYDGIEVGHAIRRVYGSRNYNRIAYEWHPNPTKGHATLAFNVLERPQVYVKAGIHYHTFSDVALILGGEIKNFIFDRSKATVKMNVSENFRLLLEQNQLIGKKDNANLIASFYHETFNFPFYENFNQQYLYRSRTTNFDLRIQRTFGFSSAIGVGTTIENFRLKPKIAADIAVQAENTYLESYLFYKHNTLNKRNFSTRGWRIDGRFGLVYNQRPSPIKVAENGELVETDTSLNAYPRLHFKAENFLPLSQRFTLLTQFNTAINFNSSSAYINFWNIGGINDFVRNQIPFSGLKEYMVNTHSVSVLMLGLQYQISRSLYATARINTAVYDFLNINNQFKSASFLNGGALSIGYDSGIGPISVSAMYSAESNSVYGYVNVGFPFR